VGEKGCIPARAPRAFTQSDKAGASGLESVSRKSPGLDTSRDDVPSQAEHCGIVGGLCPAAEEEGPPIVRGAIPVETWTLLIQQDPNGTTLYKMTEAGCMQGSAH
jgi:hypothetical protein